MNRNFQNKFTEDLEGQLILKAQNMSNSELRDALLEVRKTNITEEKESVRKFDGNSQKSLLLEGVYSQELKRRELLEWALKTGTE